eukprot:jgi/Ulvmu1/3556/UM166_0010.1
MEADNPACSIAADDIGCPDADVSRYIQDVDDNDVQDLDYSLAVQDYTPGNGAGQQARIDQLFGPAGLSHERAKSARPASAAPRSRRATCTRAVSAKASHSTLHRVSSIPPSRWNSVDVGVWLCSIGMGQYKKAFLHNQVDGPLLLALDIGLLKHELRISSLGHRVAIYDAIVQLRACDPQSERSLSPAARQGLSKATPMQKLPRPSSAPSPLPRRPTSGRTLPPDNFLGPVAGKQTVYESLKRLKYDLGRAQERARHVEAVKLDLERKHNIYQESVSRVKGELTALTKMNQLKLQDTWSPSNHKDGAVPWMHTGCRTQARKEFPERYGAPGDGSRAEETFAPRLTNTPTARERRDAVATTPFVMRLQSAQAKHAADLAQLHARLYSSPRAELSKHDLDSVQAYFTSCTGDDALPEAPAQRDTRLNEMLDDAQVQKDLSITPQLLQMIIKRQGRAKLHAISALLKQKSFMSRLHTKSRRGPATRQPRAMVNPQGKLPQEARQHDMDESRQLASHLGWAQGMDEVDPSMCTDRIQGVYARAAYFKAGKVTEKDSGKTFIPDWEKLQGESSIQATLAQEMASVMEAKKAADPECEPEDLVLQCTHLLSNMADSELRYHTSESYNNLSAEEQLLLFFRAFRGQQFLQRQQQAVTQKHTWVEQELTRSEVSRKKVTKKQQDEFFARLMQDSQQRATKKATAMSEKIAREAAILKSSKLWGISAKLCRTP